MAREPLKVFDIIDTNGETYGHMMATNTEQVQRVIAEYYPHLIGMKIQESK